MMRHAMMPIAGHRGRSGSVEIGGDDDTHTHVHHIHTSIHTHMTIQTHTYTQMVLCSCLHVVEISSCMKMHVHCT